MFQSKKIKYLLFATLIALVGVWVMEKSNTDIFSSPTTQANSELPSAIAVKLSEISTSVEIRGVIIPVEIATGTAIQKGLSGRASLNSESGMLFVFSKPDIYRFWMPNMNFPLDIIWINRGKVVDITKNALNNFDPANPRFYTPSTPARYVLEVNAGFTEKKHIKTGDMVILKGI
jgi:hypothetical protein